MDTYNIKVFNLTGTLVKELYNCQNNTIVDISVCPVGIYILKISGESTSFIGKLIKD